MKFQFRQYRQAYSSRNTESDDQPIEPMLNVRLQHFEHVFSVTKLNRIATLEMLHMFDIELVAGERPILRFQQVYLPSSVTLVILPMRLQL